MKNEITLRMNCDIKKFRDILKNKGFRVVDNFLLDDVYFIPKNIDINSLSTREILSFAVLLRNIVDSNPTESIYKLTYKKKEFDQNGDILSQLKIDCPILNLEAGRNFIQAIRI